MEKRTLEQLDAALAAVGNDLSPRIEELAQKSTEGQLTPEESQDYAEISAPQVHAPAESMDVPRRPCRVPSLVGDDTSIPRGALRPSSWYPAPGVDP